MAELRNFPSIAKVESYRSPRAGRIRREYRNLRATKDALASATGLCVHSGPRSVVTWIIIASICRVTRAHCVSSPANIPPDGKRRTRERGTRRENRENWIKLKQERSCFSSYSRREFSLINLHLSSDEPAGLTRILVFLLSEIHCELCPFLLRHTKRYARMILPLPSPRLPDLSSPRFRGFREHSARPRRPRRYGGKVSSVIHAFAQRQGLAACCLSLSLCSAGTFLLSGTISGTRPPKFPAVRIYTFRHSDTFYRTSERLLPSGLWKVVIELGERQMMHRARCDNDRYPSLAKLPTSPSEERPFDIPEFHAPT